MTDRELPPRVRAEVQRILDRAARRKVIRKRSLRVTAKATADGRTTTRTIRLIAPRRS